jgi:hypothetical protein
MRLDGHTDWARAAVFLPHKPDLDKQQRHMAALQSYGRSSKRSSLWTADGSRDDDESGLV